jgi:hypothetical protein
MVQSSAAERVHPQTSGFSKILFGATIFLSAFLLFQVQLVLAKFLLPWFGGTPSVWTACLLFFQLLLFAGYLYAHWLTRQEAKLQRVFHMVLVALALGLMIALMVRWGSPLLPEPGLQPQAPSSPIWVILLLLTWAVGAPFFVLSTTGPLMQEWYTRVRPGESPYFLYAISNIGSLLGLLSYPSLVEPYLTIHHQANFWAAGFVLFAIAVSVCALWLRPEPVAGHRNISEQLSTGSSTAPDEPATPLRIQLLWFALAGCGSVMLLATTNQICQDIAVVPLLWVVPLALYLLSFILVFAWPSMYWRAIFQPLYAFVVALSALILRDTNAIRITTLIIVFSSALFVGCIVLHGELVRLKPKTHDLTRFYLWISLGGAVGAVLVCVVAPVIFNRFWEFQFGLWTTGLLLFIANLADRDSWLHHTTFRMFWALLAFAAALPYLFALLKFPALKNAIGNRILLPALALCLIAWSISLLRSRTNAAGSRIPQLMIRGVVLLMLAGLALGLSSQHRLNEDKVITQKRNFYGAMTVFQAGSDAAQWRVYILRHGETWHGLQFQDPARRGLAGAYYSTRSGAGLALRGHPRAQQGLPMRIGVVGMGVGTLAVYANSGDVMRFYEINPQVLELSDPANPYFTFARDARGRIEAVLGDGRLSLQEEANQGNPQGFDVLVLDAFTSDAVPTHLLTREAFELYRKHLRDRDSIIAVHISNRALELAPVLAAAADHFGWKAIRVDSPDIGQFTFAAEWVLLVQPEGGLRFPERESNMDKFTTLAPTPGFRMWTDDYSNILQLLRRQR